MEMKTTRFMVEIVTSEKIVDDQCKDEMAQNIARAIVNEANNGMGIVPDYADTCTETVYVKEWYSDKTIIEHT
jgi:DNA mismatch repair ATPase MutS